MPGGHARLHAQVTQSDFQPALSLRRYAYREAPVLDCAAQVATSRVTGQLCDYLHIIRPNNRHG